MRRESRLQNTRPRRRPASANRRVPNAVWHDVKPKYGRRRLWILTTINNRFASAPRCSDRASTCYALTETNVRSSHTCKGVFYHLETREKAAANLHSACSSLHQASVFKPLHIPIMDGGGGQLLSLKVMRVSVRVHVRTPSTFFLMQTTSATITRERMGTFLLQLPFLFRPFHCFYCIPPGKDTTTWSSEDIARPHSYHRPLDTSCCIRRYSTWRNVL